MKKMKVNGFDFQTNGSGRELVVDLNNGSTWRIDESLHLCYNGPEDRTATKTERNLLQIAVNAFMAYLNGEPEEPSLSYGDLVDIDTLADNFEWTRYPEPTEEEGGPSFVLTDCAMHYVSL